MGWVLLREEFKMNIIKALPDYLIYIVIPLVLAFWTYRDIYVLKSKGIYNQIQFWSTILTVLIGSFLFRIDKIGFFPIIVATVFLFVAIFESKEIGRLEEVYKNTDYQKVSQSEKKGKNKEKKSIPPAIKKAKLNFTLALVVGVLSFLNFLGTFDFLLNL